MCPAEHRGSGPDGSVEQLRPSPPLAPVAGRLAASSTAETALIAIPTGIGITGTPAVAIVVAFALAERLAYVRWFKKGTGDGGPRPTGPVARYVLIRPGQAGFQFRRPYPARARSGPIIGLGCGAGA
jgi:hypothetical protein